MNTAEVGNAIAGADVSRSTSDATLSCSASAMMRARVVPEVTADRPLCRNLPLGPGGKPRPGDGDVLVDGTGPRVGDRVTSAPAARPGKSRQIS